MKCKGCVNPPCEISKECGRACCYPEGAKTIGEILSETKVEK